MRVSAWFFRSIFSRFSLSALALASASFTILSTSLSLRVEAPVMEMLCSLPLPLSLAVTLRMPLASMSKVTSIWGTPRGAGGMPSRRKVPSDLLSEAISRSPWSTWISTLVWPSTAVEYTSDFLVGMVVLRVIILVITPPRVSTPRESGVTSSSRMSLTSPASTPPWMAAPTATTSSGLTVWLGVLLVMRLTSSSTAGMRVEPPTMTISSSSLVESLASLRACSTGTRQRSISLEASSSNLARVRVRSRCLGPSGVAVMKGRLISAWVALESSILAFSAASVRR